MLGKNNFKERLRKMENQDRHDRFSIRKLSIGVASVLIGFAFMTGISGRSVLADPVSASQSQSDMVKSAGSDDQGVATDANSEKQSTNADDQQQSQTHSQIQPVQVQHEANEQAVRPTNNDQQNQVASHASVGEQTSPQTNKQKSSLLLIAANKNQHSQNSTVQTEGSITGNVQSSEDNQDSLAKPIDQNTNIEAFESKVKSQKKSLNRYLSSLLLNLGAEPSGEHTEKRHYVVNVILPDGSTQKPVDLTAVIHFLPNGKPNPVCLNADPHDYLFTGSGAAEQMQPIDPTWWRFQLPTVPGYDIDMDQFKTAPNSTVEDPNWDIVSERNQNIHIWEETYPAEKPNPSYNPSIPVDFAHPANPADPATNPRYILDRNPDGTIKNVQWIVWDLFDGISLLGRDSDNVLPSRTWTIRYVKTVKYQFVDDDASKGTTIGEITEKRKVNTGEEIVLSIPEHYRLVDNQSAINYVHTSLIVPNTTTNNPILIHLKHDIVDTTCQKFFTMIEHYKKINADGTITDNFQPDATATIQYKQAHKKDAVTNTEWDDYTFDSTNTKVSSNWHLDDNTNPTTVTVTPPTVSGYAIASVNTSFDLSSHKNIIHTTYYYSTSNDDQVSKKRITRTINITNPDGSTSSTSQNVDFTRTVTVTNPDATPTVSFGKWIADTTNKWDAYTIPDYSAEGYLPYITESVGTDASQVITSIDQTSVNATTKNATINIKYLKTRSDSERYHGNASVPTTTTTNNGSADNNAVNEEEVPGVHQKLVIYIGKGGRIVKKAYITVGKGYQSLEQLLKLARAKDKMPRGYKATGKVRKVAKHVDVWVSKSGQRGNKKAPRTKDVLYVTKDGKIVKRTRITGSVSKQAKQHLPKGYKMTGLSRVHNHYDIWVKKSRMQKRR